MADNAVRIRVSADTDDAERAIGGLRGSADKLGSALGTVGKIAGGVALGAGLMQLPGILTDMVTAAAEDEKAMLRLDETLKNLNLRTNGTAESLTILRFSLDDQILSAQKLAFSDDDVRESMQRLITATDSFSEASKRQSIAMDLARGANIPLADAARLLGKVNAENVDVFKKMGITISETATEADALAVIQAKFAGQAAAYASSSAGQFEQAKIRIGELKEAIGASLLPVVAQLGTMLLDDVLPRVELFVSTITKSLTEVWGKVTPQLDAFAEHARETFEVVEEESSGFSGLMSDIFAGMLHPLKRFSDLSRSAFIDLLPHLQRFSEFAREQFVKFSAYYDESLGPALNNIVSLVKFVGEAVTGSLVNSFNDFALVVRLVVRAVDAYWPEILKIVMPVLDHLVAGFKAAFEIVTGVLDVFIKLVAGDFTGAWSALLDVVLTNLMFWVDAVKRTAQIMNATSALFLKVGVDLVMALLTGMQSAWHNVTSWLDDQLSKIPEFLKQLLLGKGKLEMAVNVSAAGERAGSGGSLFGAFAGSMVPIQEVSHGAIDPVNQSVTINVNGIVTDPVATGTAIAEALNQASLFTGPMIIAGAVQQ